MTLTPTPMSAICLLAPTTTLALISNHWILAWIGLELSMMITLLLLQKPKTARSNEASVKYFISQVIASTMILAAATINATRTGTWDITQMTDKFSVTLTILSLAFKMGAAPMHFWLPEVLQGSTMTAIFIITTWRKIAPTALIFMIWKNGHFATLSAVGILSTLVGALGAINQPQMRKMIAFSSINNTGWTLVMMGVDNALALMNMMVYINLISIILYIMGKLKTKTLKEWISLYLKAQTLGIVAALAAVATSGLPPTSGWVPKMMATDRLISEHHMTVLATVLTLISLITLLFYIRMSYISAMTSGPSTSNTPIKWRTQMHIMQLLPVLTSSIITTILLLPTIAAY
uniref:NADH-ubiquinone oxidoreductase chain 2 n=1 Tax=Agama impalearis TaxID=129731 RepID=C6KTG5_AGAIM|nr:NADH dehydrogenase subunit 2 [Agama impalearis]